MIRERARAIAEGTREAYARNRYSDGAWRACAALLLRRGFSDVEAAAILESRVMRAAADFAGAADDATSRDLARYLDDNLLVRGVDGKLVRWA